MQQPIKSARSFKRRKRTVTFPYMGQSHAVFKELLINLGNDVVVPPRPNRFTLSLGAEHSPEFACLPLKIITGSYLEAIEKGADTIVSTGGVGPCRAGLYCEIHQFILNELHLDVDLIVLEPPRVDLRDFIGKIEALNANGFSKWHVAKLVWYAWKKIIALDHIERISHRVRAREAVLGSTTKAFKKATAIINQVKTLSDLEEAEQRAEQVLTDVPLKPGFEPLRVGIVGEIYVLLEPSANLEIEETLGEMGVETERSIYLAGWTKESKLFKKPGRKNQERLEQVALSYLGEMIGGHGQDSVAHAIQYAERGFDGVIQLSPFTCIPEIVAKSVLERVSRDFSIPVLSISLDEQTGKAGFVTRLEAFADLLARRHTALQRKNACDDGDPIRQSDEDQLVEPKLSSTAARHYINE
ncbi:MAG TPA: hypothetical protein VGK02_03415 [Candidatus Aquicultor sp.]